MKRLKLLAVFLLSCFAVCGAQGSAPETKTIADAKAQAHGYAKRLAASNAVTFTMGDKGSSYFVLIGGGRCAEENFIRYWIDTAMFYSTLTKKYGVSKDHIFVYMSDGLSDEPDANIMSEEYPYLADSPKDLDGDGVGDVTGPAAKDTIRSCFAALRGRLSCSDQLVVFMTGAGMVDGEWTADNRESMFFLYDKDLRGTDDYAIKDDELASWTSGIMCPVGFLIQAGFAGGFIDDICKSNYRKLSYAFSQDAVPNRVVLTSCTHNEQSHGGAIVGWLPSAYPWDPSKSEYYSHWAAPLVASFRGHNPVPYGGIGSPWLDSSAVANADLDNDGRISFEEARWYADRTDESSCTLDTHTETCGDDHGTEHPQCGETISDMLRRFYLIKQPDVQVNPFSEALDTDLPFVCASDSIYFIVNGYPGTDVDTTISHYGGSSLCVSGSSSDLDEGGAFNRWIQTTVDGPGTVSFYWKVSCEENEDYLEFLVDGVQERMITGTGMASWKNVTVTVVGAGTHVLKWNYHKDDPYGVGEDCGWVDHVSWIGIATPPSYTVWFGAGGHGRRTGGGAAKQTVEVGYFAEEPTITPDPGYEFVGWDKPLGPVGEQNYAIFAQYRPKNCGVTFDVGAKGRRTGGGDAKQTVPFGGAAVLPTVTGYDGWKFLGWDWNVSCVTRSITATAQYDIPVCAATFVIDGAKGRHVGGGNMKQSVGYGNSPVPPGVKPKPGYTFTGWSPAIGAMNKSQTYTAMFSE